MDSDLVHEAVHNTLMPRSFTSKAITQKGSGLLRRLAQGAYSELMRKSSLDLESEQQYNSDSEDELDKLFIDVHVDTTVTDMTDVIP